MSSLAMLSLHGCPVARLGEKDTGGMNVYVLQLAREFARRGHEVDVFTKHHDPNDPKVVELEDGARVVHLEAGPYDADKYDLFNYIPTFLEQLHAFQRAEETRYDLIHSHYWLSGRAGMALSRQWNVPHTTTFHTLANTKLRARAGEKEPQLRQDVEAEVMSDSDGIVVSTDEEKQDILRFYGATSGKVEVIPAGVNLDTFTPLNKERARQKLSISEASVLLYVGRIEPLKGIDIMLRATQLLECGGNLRVLVVGGSPGSDSELERLKALAGELGIGDTVTFTGSIPQSQLPTYYSAADVFVLPSHTESFGLAALEAMACGTPVVVSRVGGLKTFVDSGETGYLVPRRCPESFAQRIDGLLANIQLRDTMGRAARVKALGMGWARVVDRMQDYYQSLISDFSPSRAPAGD